MDRLSPKMKVRLAAIKDVCSKTKNPAAIWNGIRDMILDAVPGDFGTFGIMDPITGLFVDGFSYGDRPERANTYISRFYLKREYYSYLDLRANGEVVSQASEFTGGQLEKDPVYAEWLGPEGFKHGARVSFVSGNYYWGGLCIIRGDDVADFNEQELAFLRSIVEPVGHALQLSVAWTQAHIPIVKGRMSTDAALAGDDIRLCDSGVLLLDHQHRVLFRTDGVQSIIDDIVACNTLNREDVPHRVGDALPGAMHAVSARLWTAIEKGQQLNNPSVTVKGLSQWWTVTATRPESNMPGEVATVIIISRSHPRDTAGVLLAAYGITEREEEIVNLIRTGMSTEAIARNLFVSRYTVQDHLKSIFSKVGVRTRGELMAVIFREESPVGRLVAQNEQEAGSGSG